MKPEPNDEFFDKYGNSSSDDGDAEYTYQCQSCEYLHTKFEQSPPTQCVQCGRTKFREVPNDTQRSHSMSRRNALLTALKQSSGRERIAYAILFGLFFLSIFGLVYLIV